MEVEIAEAKENDRKKWRAAAIKESGQWKWGNNDGGGDVEDNGSEILDGRLDEDGGGIVLGMI